MQHTVIFHTGRAIFTDREKEADFQKTTVGLRGARQFLARGIDIFGAVLLEHRPRSCGLIFDVNIRNNERSTTFQQLAIEEHIIVRRQLGGLPHPCSCRSTSESQQRRCTEANGKDGTYTRHKQASYCAAKRQPSAGAHSSAHKRANGFAHAVGFGVSSGKALRLGFPRFAT
jgi:hypothetical protein